ncbi:MAG: PP2C family protein-serine/threonine phosphatase [Kiloniellaceae bacterium]
MIDTGAPFHWHSASGTHVGTVRKVNEDAYVDLPGIGPEVGLWAVADGMGGHEAGDFASRMIVEALRSVPPPTGRDALLDEVDVRLQSVNRRLRDYAATHARGGVVGSTVAVLIGYRSEGICLWAGDSRVYLLRGGLFRQLTQDHSQVEELIKLGLLNRSEAASHPAGNVITRAVGAMDDLIVDAIGHELADGDIYLLCSDGLNKVLPDEEIALILERQDCRQAVQSLLQRALDKGARDNVTAIVVHARRADAG